MAGYTNTFGYQYCENPLYEVEKAGLVIIQSPQVEYGNN